MGENGWSELYYRRFCAGAWIRPPSERRPAARYAAAAAAFALAFALRNALSPDFGPHTFILYYPVVIFAAVFGGLGPGLLCVGLSLAGAAYFVPRPIGSAEALSFSLFALVGSTLALIVEALHRARSSLRSAFEHAGEILESVSDAFYSVDDHWRFTAVNRAAERYWGKARRDLLGQSIWAVFPEAVGSEIHRAHLEAAERGAAVELETTMRHGPVSLSMHPRPGGLAVFFRDIAQRKKTEERFRLVVEQSPNAILIVGRDGRITYVNAQAEKLFLYPQEELKGELIEILVPPRFRAKHPGYRDGFLAEPKARPMGAGRDLFGLRKDGSEVPVEIGLNPFQSEEGPFVLASIIDITERKKTEQALILAREELARRAESLEETVAKRTRHLQQVIGELEMFCYTASHDLRAPSRALQGYAHFLLERLGDRLDEESRALLERMASSATRMDRLVQDLLTYSRIGLGEEKMQPVDLDAAVSQLVGHYPGLDKLRIRVKSPLGRVIGHDSLVAQTLSNLLGNAVKFVPRDRTPTIDIWTERKGERVTLFIQDNGIGIAPEYYAKIFNPFVRLDPTGPHEGTGIGLAVVKKAVERMGGWISVQSEIGKGSRFAVDLAGAS